MNRHSSGKFRLAGCLPIVLAMALACFAAGARGQTSWNDPVTNTPAIVQTDFGPYGTSLPDAGENYCGPTSDLMALFWLSSNGYTQLAPATYPGQQSPVTLNLEELLAGLEGVSASKGTYDSNMAQGLRDYFSAEGLSGAFSDTYLAGSSASNIPSPATMARQLQANSGANPGSITFVTFLIDWFESTGTAGVYTSNGGHYLDLLTVNSGSSITINNAYPNTFEDVPNIPSSDPETVGLASVPGGLTLVGTTTTGLPSQDFYEIMSPLTGGSGQQLAVVQSSFAWTISSSASLANNPSFQPAPWVINDEHYLNTNSAQFVVQAPVTGSGGIDKEGLGSIVLTNTNTLSGLTTVHGGTLASTMASGTPFGTGSVNIQFNGHLLFEPSGTGGTPAVTLAGGSGNKLTIGDGGGELDLARGSNASLSVTIGGNTDTTTANIVRRNHGTLVIAASGGFSALGTTEQVFVAGSVSNLAATSPDIVSPYIVGQNNDTAGSGSFLTYTASTGFIQATLTQSSTLGINAATSTTAYDVVGSQAISSGSTATVGAVQVENGQSISGAGATLEVGSQQPGDSAGIILNGGAITAAGLQFGNAEGVVYSSNAGGTISSVISGSAGMTTFGPGALTLTGASQLGGAVSVNSGTVIAANTQGSATGTAAVEIYHQASLVVQGNVSGSIGVENAGTLLLNGGTVNNLSIAATGTDSATPGGTLEGYGTVTGSASIQGVIMPGPTSGTLAFTGNVDVENASYYWQLDALTADDSELGIDWNLTTFSGSGVVGTKSDPVTVFVSFATALQDEDPNSDNSFWDSRHAWVLWEFSGTDTTPYVSEDGNFTWADGNFHVQKDNDGDVVLVFEPVPEPCAWLLIACGAVAFAVAGFLKRKQGAPASGEKV